MAVIPTENHGFKKQERGDDDWDVALNETLDILDVDVVLRGPKADLPAAGQKGRIYIATDTNELFHDNGSSFNQLLSLNHNDLNNLSDDDHPQYLLADGTRAMSGSLDMGTNPVVNAERFHANQQPLKESMETGLVSGGDVVRGPGTREIIVKPGVGFVKERSTEGDLGENIRVVFNQQSLTVPQNTSAFVAVDSTGTASLSTTQPEKTTNLILANVGTANDEIGILATHETRVGGLNARVSDYAREVIGPVPVTGGLASESETNPLGLDVEAVQYYVSNDEKTLPGTQNIEFDLWYRDTTDTFSFESNNNEIDPTIFDDGLGNPVEMPDGKFKKDVLFLHTLNGTPQYNVLLAQETFDDQAAAAAAEPPSLRDNALAPFILRTTGIVTQKSSTSIEQITDERAFVGQFKARRENTQDHGNLTGLDDDDHPQYLLEPEVRDVAREQSQKRLDKVYYRELEYTSTNSMPTGQVIYIRVYLEEGETYSGVDTYHTSSSSADRAVGVYDEANNQPNQLLETSGVVATTLQSGDFTSVDFQNQFTVPASDHYYIAFIGSSSTNTFVSTSINSNVPSTSNTPFVGAFEESRSISNGLPTTASPSVFKSNLPFIALRR